MQRRRPLRVIELITLLVVLGIVGAIVLPRLSGNPERVSENPSSAHQVKP